ncbi:unnamed protein product [Haemonchus placei]|uniref:Uncharacterized protein n=1 Tax=Haemonchus placei TaxID=6290 RepID=A0A0N4WBW5_HAEPC|nr:unnamed protein product [Haemonchus placei]
MPSSTTQVFTSTYTNHWFTSGIAVVEDWVREPLGGLEIAVIMSAQDNTLSSFPVHTTMSSRFRPIADIPLRRSLGSEEEVSGEQGTQQRALHGSQEIGVSNSLPSGLGAGPPHVSTLLVN